MANICMKLANESNKRGNKSRSKIVCKVIRTICGGVRCESKSFFGGLFMKSRPFILLAAIAVMLLAIIAFALAPSAPKGIGVAVASTTAVTAFVGLQPIFTPVMVANRADPPYHQRVFDYDKPQDRKIIDARFSSGMRMQRDGVT
jgi:hypothetical protein